MFLTTLLLVFVEGLKLKNHTPSGEKKVKPSQLLAFTLTEEVSRPYLILGHASKCCNDHNELVLALVRQGRGLGLGPVLFFVKAWTTTPRGPPAQGANLLSQF